MTEIITAIVYILTFVISYLALKWYQSHNGTKHDGRYKLPPCLPYLPIVGSLLFIPDLKRFYVYFMKRSKELGNIVAFYMGGRYVIILNGRKTIHEAFVKHAVSFSSRPNFLLEKIFNPDQGGIIERPYDEEFKKYHRACVNVFKQFGFGQGVMETRIQIEVEDLIQRIKLKNGQEFDPRFDLTAAIANVIGSILFGNRWAVDDPEFCGYIDKAEIIVRGYIINFLPALRFLPYFRQLYTDVVRAFENYVMFINKMYVKILNDKKTDHFCNKFIEILTKSGEFNLKDHEQLKLTIRDFFITGTETTSNSLYWFIYFMANNQSVQKLVRDELVSVVGNNRLPSLEDRQNLPITEASILEVMRIRTLLPTAVPHMTTNETVINGVCIPSGVIVLANIYSAHMDPDVWEEPEKFRIDRFLNESRTEVINRDLMISFSLGKRSCIGEVLARQELFLFTSTLVQNFEILPPEGHGEIITEELFGATVGLAPFKARFIKRI